MYTRGSDFSDESRGFDLSIDPDQTDNSDVSSSSFDHSSFKSKSKHSASPFSFLSNLSAKSRSLLSIAGVVVLLLGLAATLAVVKTSQDIRQQASGIDNCCGQPDYKGGATCSSTPDWEAGYYACQRKECSACANPTATTTASVTNPPAQTTTTQTTGTEAQSSGLVFLSTDIQEPVNNKCPVGWDKRCGSCLSGKCSINKDPLKYCDVLIKHYCSVDPCYETGTCTKPYQNEGDYCDSTSTCAPGTKCINNTCQPDPTATKTLTDCTTKCDAKQCNCPSKCFQDKVVKGEQCGNVVMCYTAESKCREKIEQTQCQPEASKNQTFSQLSDCTAFIDESSSDDQQSDQLTRCYEIEFTFNEQGIATEASCVPTNDIPPSGDCFSLPGHNIIFQYQDRSSYANVYSNHPIKDEKLERIKETDNSVQTYKDYCLRTVTNIRNEINADPYIPSEDNAQITVDVATTLGGMPDTTGILPQAKPGELCNNDRGCQCQRDEALASSIVADGRRCPRSCWQPSGDQAVCKPVIKSNGEKCDEKEMFSSRIKCDAEVKKAKNSLIAIVRDFISSGANILNLVVDDQDPVIDDQIYPGCYLLDVESGLNGVITGVGECQPIMTPAGQTCDQFLNSKRALDGLINPPYSRTVFSFNGEYFIGDFDRQGESYEGLIAGPLAQCIADRERLVAKLKASGQLAGRNFDKCYLVTYDSYSNAVGSRATCVLYAGTSNRCDVDATYSFLGTNESYKIFFPDDEAGCIEQADLINVDEVQLSAEDRDSGVQTDCFDVLSSCDRTASPPCDGLLTHTTRTACNNMQKLPECTDSGNLVPVGTANADSLIKCLDKSQSSPVFKVGCMSGYYVSDGQCVLSKFNIVGRISDFFTAWSERTVLMPTTPPNCFSLQLAGSPTGVGQPFCVGFTATDDAPCDTSIYSSYDKGSDYLSVPLQSYYELERDCLDSTWLLKLQDPSPDTTCWQYNSDEQGCDEVTTAQSTGDCYISQLECDRVNHSQASNYDCAKLEQAEDGFFTCSLIQKTTFDECSSKYAVVDKRDQTNNTFYNRYYDQLPDCQAVADGANGNYGGSTQSNQATSEAGTSTTRGWVVRAVDLVTEQFRQLLQFIPFINNNVNNMSPEDAQSCPAAETGIQLFTLDDFNYYGHDLYAQVPEYSVVQKIPCIYGKDSDQDPIFRYYCPSGSAPQGVKIAGIDDVTKWRTYCRTDAATTDSPINPAAPEAQNSTEENCYHLHANSSGQYECTIVDAENCGRAVVSFTAGGTYPFYTLGEEACRENLFSIGKDLGVDKINASTFTRCRDDAATLADAVDVVNSVTSQTNSSNTASFHNCLTTDGRIVYECSDQNQSLRSQARSANNNERVYSCQ